MDLKQLRYFIAVAENESFSKAAVLLAMSQPALSRQMKAIEAEFGVELLCRNGRGVTLTEPGRQFLSRARALLEEYQEMRTEMLSLRNAPIGEVTMGIPPLIGDVLIKPLVKQFRASFPKVSLHLIEGLSGHVYEWLSTGRVDVAVLYNAPMNGALVAEPLLEDDLGLIGPVDSALEGFSIDKKTLADVPLVMPSRSHGNRALADSWAVRNGVRLRIMMQVDAFHSTLDLVEAGAGYTILPYTAVHRKVEAGRLRFWSLPEPRMTGVFSLAASTQRPRTPATRYLVANVREQVRLLVKSGSWRRRSDPPLVPATPASNSRLHALERSGPLQ